MSKLDQKGFILNIDQKQLSYEIASIVKVYLLVLLILWGIIFVVLEQLFDLKQLPTPFYIVLLSLPAISLGYKYGIHNGEFEKTIQVQDTDVYIQCMIETLHQMQFDMISTNYNILSFVSRKIRNYKERILVSINHNTNQIKHSILRPTYKVMISRIIESLGIEHPSERSKNPRISSVTFETDNLRKTIDERRCCKMNGRNGDKLCNICGRAIPEDYRVVL